MSNISNGERAISAQAGELTGKARVEALLGKTAADFETTQQLAERIAREDIARKTVLPADKRGVHNV